MCGLLTLSKKYLGPLKKWETKQCNQFHGVQKRCNNNGKRTHNDIIHFVLFDLLTSKINVDLDPTMGVLFFGESGTIPQCRSRR